MKSILRTAFIVIWIILTACRDREDNLFEFTEKNLSVIENKLYEFESLEKSSSEDIIAPIFIANLLDDSIAYNDAQNTVLRDSTYKGRFNPANILNQNKRKIDIYRILLSGDSGANNHILLITGHKMTFINTNNSYNDVVEAVLHFFEKNNEVDQRLMPLYIQKITWWYLRNHWKDERGEWHDWFNKKDSISMEYYQFQYPQ